MESEPLDTSASPTANTADALEALAQSESRLRSLQTELTRDHALALLGLHAAMIAHEFNNLLTPVVTLAQHALTHPDDRSLATRALERALIHSQRAASVAQSLLALARGDRRGRKDRSDVANAVNEAFACLGRDPCRDGVSVVVEVPGALTVLVSPVLLSQMILNVLTNALGAMRPGGGSLEISVCAQDAHVELRVRDTGRGMSAADLARAGAALQSERGHGLGLEFCRTILRSVGGDLRISSQPGVGTTVCLLLPRFITGDDHDILRRNTQMDGIADGGAVR